MRLQDLGFLGLGNAPWGVGTPGVTSGSSASTTRSSNGNSAATDTLSNIGSALNSALSNSLTGSATELAVMRESETLKIQLTDGSQVTIRMRAQGVSLNAAQTQPDGMSSSTAAIFASGQLQVSVDGNLSSADEQAISDVVTQVNSLATQFFSGDVQDAFAAAASLNIDPREIAGFSMKLSYSSTLIQQAAASGASSGPAGPTSSAPSGGQPLPAGTSSSASATPTATTSTSQPAANAPSPQQIIINFVRTVTAKLGRGSADSHSQLRVSSRWKLHLLAQALPAYAQAQASDAAATGTTTTTVPTTPAAAAQNVQPPAVQGATSAAAATLPVASDRYPSLQAARLAADTFSQLAQ